MRTLGKAVAAICLVFALDAASAEVDLAGLWKAKQRFGPDTRGTLVLHKTGTTWAADFLGRMHPVRVDGADLRFELPGDAGSLRVRQRHDGTITGQWNTPPSPVNGARYASPVVLRAAGPNRWQGTVAPLIDEYTMYLKVDQRPDGTLGAFMRNPDRNDGVFLDVDHLELAGDEVRLVGKRRGSKEEETLLTGRYDAENDVISVYYPGRGGTYDFRRDGGASAFFPRPWKDRHYTYRAPPALDDGWPVGTLDEAHIDRAAIERFVQSLIDQPVENVHTPSVEAILIARHGKLVLEEYFHGESRDRLHETRSASKSMTATIIGAALRHSREGGNPALTLQSPVYAVMSGGAFPESLEARKRTMTLEHLLTMRSGFFCDDNNDDAPGNENKMQEQSEEPDWYKYSLAVPQSSAPDTESVYCSMMPNLALGMVERSMGEPALDVFDRLVAAPLGITTYAWFLDNAGHAYGGGGARFLPLDFMKMGQVMLDGGTWRGRRIVSREFAERASAPLHKLGRNDYGYLWWGTTYPYQDRTVRAYFAAGNGGQIVMVIPELDLVIAAYSANYADRAALFMQQDAVPRFILPAIH